MTLFWHLILFISLILKYVHPSNSCRNPLSAAGLLLEEIRYALIRKFLNVEKAKLLANSFIESQFNY